MGLDDDGDLGFQQRVGSLLNCPSSGIHMASQPQKAAGTTMSPISMCKSSNGVDSFYNTGWDPLVSPSPNVGFRGSSVAAHHHISTSSYGGDVLESHGNSSTSPLVQCPSDLSLIELAPKLSCYGSGSFSEMVSSFGLPQCGQFANSDDPSDYPSNKEGGTKNFLTNSRRVVDHGAIFQENLPISDEAGAPSPNGMKRKRVLEHHAGETHSQFDSIQSVKVELQKDASQETLEGLKEKDKKKQKNEHNSGTKLCDKITDKQPKDSSRNGKDPKEDYIHVRAKRGQATNSHSLAERVRREKISERMRFLQELVPGCNKVTGKAVMLDEIINYVQSLQRQVEFLSMKLATVNPELNINIERILSKDILHSSGGGSAILGFGPGTSSSHPQSLIFPQDSMHAIHSTHPQLVPMPHVPSIWDDELQGVIEMGFNSNSAANNLCLNGTSH